MFGYLNNIICSCFSFNCRKVKLDLSEEENSTIYFQKTKQVPPSLPEVNEDISSDSDSDNDIVNTGLRVKPYSRNTSETSDDYKYYHNSPPDSKHSPTSPSSFLQKREPGRHPRYGSTDVNKE